MLTRWAMPRGIRSQKRGPYGRASPQGEREERKKRRDIKTYKSIKRQRKEL